MNTAKIKSDLSNLVRGQIYIYHTGNADTLKSSLAQFAYELYENERVYLLQRKMIDGVFEYIAIGRI